MTAPARFRLDKGVVRLSDDWTAAGLGRTGAALRAAVAGAAADTLSLDFTDLGRFDTAGAQALVRAGLGEAPRTGSARSDVPALLALVATVALSTKVAPPRPRGPVALLERMGRGVAYAGAEGLFTLVFLGRLVSALGRVVARPRRLRLAPTVALMERAGLDALPIVAVTSFFVGATIAFLGEDLLTQFGAQVFAVELIGIAELREFGVLVTAIILAGRSASSFAAEIGAMRMNQEVDAMAAMGVDPFEALVIPRFTALVAMTPLLTFVATVAGLMGGMGVVWAVAGLSPAFFLQRLLDQVGPVHFYIGMAKAPVLAAVIAAIGCRHGMEVAGDVESLGRRTTTAVVEALFAIIMIDAVFALLFLEVGT